MQWGRWFFDTETLALITKIKDTGKIYYLPLTKCNSAAEILDWIATIHEKTWTTNKDIGDLIEALNDLLNFQENFSNNGKESSYRSQDYSLKIIERRLRFNQGKDFR